MAAKTSRSKKRRLITVFIIVLIIAGYVGSCLLLPLRDLSANQANSTLKITTPPSSLPWPSYGEGAVGLGDGTLIQVHGNQTPLPTASVAKLITAFAVLNKHPLSLGQTGPTITLDTTDYSFYSRYVSEQGSVVLVTPGEKLTEYEMLQAMLIPSGNNIADSLARWAFGSVSNYDSFANSFVKQLGLTNTTVAGDASGYLPSTTSTAKDLIKLGGLVMQNTVLKQIVGQKSADLPGVGIVQNFDNILGDAGIVGIKTGNSNQAGGVFLAAANSKVNGKTVTVLSALMGAPNLAQVLSDSVPLVIAVENDFAQSILVSQGEVLGEFKEPWGGIVQIAAQANLLRFVLQGETAQAHLDISSLKVPSQAGTKVGKITTDTDQFNQGSSVSVITVQSTSRPSLVWRLEHPNYIF